MQTETTAIPLIHTKLQRPPVSPDILPRPRLLEFIDQGRKRPLTLISAPAGYGKSTLASRWLEVCECPCAWISLDEHDNDLRMFLSYVTNALGAIFPAAAEKTQRFLEARNLPPFSVLAPILLNDLDTIDEDFFLVLDDYHCIHETTIHDLMAVLLQHPPRAMHLVLLARRDPPLPLVRLRARRQMNEITMEQLRFTCEETAAFLEKALEFSIDDSTAAVLEEGVEGWVTGLRLAALSVRGKEDLNRLLSGVQKGFHYITDYLISEVISRLPPALAQYMMEVAILDRFCPALCEAIHVSKGEPRENEISGEAFMEWLYKRHLFVVPLDEQHRWFRYHHLFQDLLKNQLKRGRSSQEIATLHSRASEWLESQGFLSESIEHAVAAGDIAGASELVERYRLDELDNDRWFVVKNWLDKLPADIRRQRLELILTQAWIHQFELDLKSTLSILKQAESVLESQTAGPDLLAEVDFFRSVLLYFEGDGKRSGEHSEKALARFSRKQGVMAGEMVVYHSMARHMNGEGESVIHDLKEKIRETDSEKESFITRLEAAQAYVHLLSGDLLSAARCGQQVEAIARRMGSAYAEVWGRYIQALTQFHSHRLDDALQSFEIVAEQRDFVERILGADSLVGMTLTCQTMQHPDRATHAAEELMAFARQTADRQCIEMAESCRARLSLLQGDLESAIDWARSADVDCHAPAMLFWLEIPCVTKARVQIAEGTEESIYEALEALSALRPQVESIHSTYQAIDIRILQSLALARQGHTEKALSELEEAVALATPGGWIRPFVEAGPPMTDMLQQLHKQNVAVGYIERLLTAFGDDEAGPSPRAVSPSPLHPLSTSPSAQPLVEPLTNRESEILELLAQRRQNKEIAEKLFVSAETVKSHLKNIYGKLNVTNRREAVTRARSLGILLPR
ncbi:MAG: LuxR C-terminal-related transcriptional regulator [Syntrophobacterales bacterium]|jgi:LuxR family maltose regulon positive regulatory protein